MRSIRKFNWNVKFWRCLFLWFEFSHWLNWLELQLISCDHYLLLHIPFSYFNNCYPAFLTIKQILMISGWCPVFDFKRVRDLHYNLLIKISAHWKKEKGNSLGIGVRRDIWDCGVLKGRDLPVLGDRRDFNKRIFNRSPRIGVVSWVRFPG